jgi:molybdopterin-guanine dinucleotide biosynthesis protein B
MGERPFRKVTFKQGHVDESFHGRNEVTVSKKMKPIVIAVVGSQNSGKTTTIEVLTRELTKRGYKIATVKHIPEPDFTIDAIGKDTWRFAQAGAKTIVAVSANEIATIEKLKTESFSLEMILQKCEGNDVVFLEGLRKLISKYEDIHKIVVVKSAEETLEAVKNLGPIVAFTGPYVPKNNEIPYEDVLKNPEKLADLVEKVIGKRD